MRRRPRRTPKYEFQFGEPALVLELFLPKRAEFQTLLYETINNGFKLDVVKAHLRKHWRRIARLLNNSFAGERHFQREVRELQHVFGGYSLFEVDGAFERPSQERTQIVRIFFLPPLDRIARTLGLNLEAIRFSARRFLRHWTHDRDLYLRHIQSDAHELASLQRVVLSMEDEARLIDELQRWLSGVHLFATGYMVDAISSGIGRLYQSRAIGVPEKEIWVGSFRDVAVNKIQLAKPPRRRPNRRHP